MKIEEGFYLKWKKREGKWWGAIKDDMGRRKLKIGKSWLKIEALEGKFGKGNEDLVWDNIICCDGRICFFFFFLPVEMDGCH